MIAKGGRPGDAPLLVKVGMAWRVPVVPLVAVVLVTGLFALSLAAWIATRGSDEAVSSGSHEGPAASGTTVSPAAAEAAGSRAIALVDGPTPAELGYRLKFLPPRGDGVRAETDRDARMITVFAAPAEAPHVVAHDLAHEIGHALDDVALTAAARREYLARRGEAGARWWPGGAFADYDTGAGDFAEVYALCRAASPQYRSTLAPRPADACALVSGLPTSGGREKLLP